MVHATAWPTVTTRRAARVEAILSAALGLVFEHGIDAFTIRALAAELGVSLGAVYRYFDSKEALLAELQVRILARLGEGLDEACEAVPSAPPHVRSLAKLCAAADHYATLPATAPEVARLLAVLLGDPRVLFGDAEAKKVIEAALPVLERIARRFAEAGDLGALGAGDPRDRAIVLWSSLQGVLQLGKLARVEPEALSPARHVRTLVDALLVGWGAKPAKLAAARALLSENTP